MPQAVVSIQVWLGYSRPRNAWDPCHTQHSVYKNVAPDSREPQILDAHQVDVRMAELGIPENQIKRERWLAV